MKKREGGREREKLETEIGMRIESDENKEWGSGGSERILS